MMKLVSLTFLAIVCTSAVPQGYQVPIPQATFDSFGSAASRGDSSGEYGSTGSRRGSSSGSHGFSSLAGQRGVGGQRESSERYDSSQGGRRHGAGLRGSSSGGHRSAGGLGGAGGHGAFGGAGGHGAFGGASASEYRGSSVGGVSGGVGGFGGRGSGFSGSDEHQEGFQRSGPVIPILRDNREGPIDGYYKFDFETGDGIVREEEGTPTGPNGAVVQQGSWSFTFPDGTPAEFSFVADENGYRVESPLLPTPPPLPPHAIAQIEKAERERAAGIVHDGSYSESFQGSSRGQPGYQGGQQEFQGGHGGQSRGQTGFQEYQGPQQGSVGAGQHRSQGLHQGASQGFQIQAQKPSQTYNY